MLFHAAPRARVGLRFHIKLPVRQASFDEISKLSDSAS